jgi:hypothetical protein
MRRKVPPHLKPLTENLFKNNMFEEGCYFTSEKGGHAQKQTISEITTMKIMGEGE